MYKVSKKTRLLSFALIVVGIVLFAIGYNINHHITTEDLKQFIADNPEYYTNEIVSSTHHLTVDNSPEEILKKAEHQVHNRPWSALMVAAYLFFGIGVTALFFLAVQHAAQAGWSVVVHRVMEAVSSIIPVAGFFVLIVALGAALHWNHLYHWMDPDLVDPKSKHYDEIIHMKSDFLNVPFFSIRVIFYVLIFTFLFFWMQRASKKLDEEPTKKNYWTLYKKAVITIVFFSLLSMAYAWDFIMSIDPHWYSTLFGWYLMVSHMVSAVACIILFSIFLKKAGFLPQFNDNHLHDLTKYMFAFSLLWTYMWYAQFMLYWYANIPEEVIYFQSRIQLYKESFFPMLIPNFLLPLLVLVSSSMKRRYTIVAIMAVIIILGHYIDYFNAVMPGTVGPFWNIGLLEIGALLFMVGIFILVVTYTLSKLKLQPTGNPLYHESEIFEYPH